MGQYYLIVNVDRQEYLNPHDFGDGLKLMEFGNSQGGVLTGLAVLLADGNNRGGGDLRSDHDIIGSWAGDRIVVAGDYADKGGYDEVHDDETLYRAAENRFENVSDETIRAIVDGEGDWHPLADIDFDDDGWRSRGTFGT